MTTDAAGAYTHQSYTWLQHRPVTRHTQGFFCGSSGPAEQSKESVLGYFCNSYRMAAALLHTSSTSQASPNAREV